MMVFRTIFICLFIISLISPAHAIVRKDTVLDSCYLELGKQFESVVKIETETSFGSGVLLDTNTIITSSHNIKNKKNIKVVINYVEYIPYNIVYHKDLDLVLLRINNKIHKDKTELYKDQYLNEKFIIVGYGFTGVGSKGYALRDFKRRGAEVRCQVLNKGFGECTFLSDDDLELGGCVAPGDSGGGVFKDNKLAGIITYVTGKGSDGKGDSTYNDKSAFIPINTIEEWIIDNL